MNSYFQTITEANKFSLDKPADTDVVYYSELKEWFTTNAFRSFSLKYVIDNCIYYKAGRKEHAVGPGNLLLACRQPHVKAYFETPKLVKSICIDIRPETVAEAFTVMTDGKDHDFDNYLDRYFRYPEFFETVFPAGTTTALSNKLNNLVDAIRRGDADRQVNREWFYDLVEKIIYHEYGNYLALNGIRSVKLETRKELLARLTKAKHFMDESFLSIEEVSEVAVYCNLSEFHFFRSFRQAFGSTPYQYILNKRLELSRELLQKRNMPVAQVALECNFPDIFTFSKAFKRHYGISPSQFGKQQLH